MSSSRSTSLRGHRPRTTARARHVNQPSLRARAPGPRAERWSAAQWRPVPNPRDAWPRQLVQDIAAPTGLLRQVPAHIALLRQPHGFEGRLQVASRRARPTIRSARKRPNVLPTVCRTSTPTLPPRTAELHGGDEPGPRPLSHASGNPNCDVVEEYSVLPRGRTATATS